MTLSSDDSEDSRGAPNGSVESDVVSRVVSEQRAEVQAICEEPDAQLSPSGIRTFYQFFEAQCGTPPMGARSTSPDQPGPSTSSGGGTSKRSADAACTSGMAKKKKDRSVAKKDKKEKKITVRALKMHMTVLADPHGTCTAVTAVVVR